jgi:L-methionine (R)-S-oxide reductase
MSGYDEVMRDVETEAARSGPEQLMLHIVRRLSALPRFDWVGFYLLNAERILELGAYAGAPTPHTRIPLHQGICGAAASSGETVVVDDVNADPRYLACSLETKSEIVVPIFVGGAVAGEIDIDSHAPAAFGRAERELVEHCAALAGRALEAPTP